MKWIHLLLITATLSYRPALCEVNKNKIGSNILPFSFGEDQTIIDLKKVIWEPLKVTGLPPGAEIAILRGKLET